MTKSALIRWCLISACILGAAAGGLVALRRAGFVFPGGAEGVRPDAAHDRGGAGRRQSGDHGGPMGAKCAIQLRDVSQETGIRFRHTDGSSGLHYIVEAMSTGIATFDYDGDGLIDIYFPNGAPLPGTTAEKPPRHALYRNLGGWRFQEVTDSAGLVCTAYGLGVTVGDYDSDGWVDIYLNNFGPNILFKNNGDGTFRDVTQQAGVARGDLVGAGACFFDPDADGDLDLYVGNYIALNCAEHVPRNRGGVPSYPTPQEYAAVPDTLYRNESDGSFRDVSAESGVAAHAGRSMGMTCADYDNDGDADVFVCNDVQENFLFQNDGTGRFEQIANLVGAAWNSDGQILANMAVDAADYNNDGWLDFYTTNYQSQLPVLFRNLGGGMLDDVTVRANAGEGCFEHVNWGCGFADLDNDGDRDLFIGNGHTEDNIERMSSTGQYRARCVVLSNAGGRFTNVTDQTGPGLDRKLVARGVALDDLDNDGDTDIVVLGSREAPLILRNLLRESNASPHWLQIRLVGVAANRNGVGSRVKVVAGDLSQIDEVHSGRGYQSHSGMLLHFGLGSRQRVDRIEVSWIGGGKEIVTDVAADQVITIVQSPLHPVSVPLHPCDSEPKYALGYWQP